MGVICPLVSKDMPHSTYPVAADVTGYVTGAGIDLPSTLVASGSISNYLAEAIAWWENETGWLPFLSTGTVTTRTFDPPGIVPPDYGAQPGGGRILKLDAGLISLSGAGLQLDTVGKTLGTDYWLYPQNKTPWTVIRFYIPCYTQIQGISITGVWGYTLSCPDDAWSAIAKKAASLLIDAVIESIRGYGALYIQEKDFQNRFSEKILTEATGIWRQDAERCVQRYKRVEAYL